MAFEGNVVSQDDSAPEPKRSKTEVLAGEQDGDWDGEKKQKTEPPFNGKFDKDWLLYLKENLVEPGTRSDFFTSTQPGLVSRFGMVSAFSARIGYCQFYHVSCISMLSTYYCKCTRAIVEINFKFIFKICRYLNCTSISQTPAQIPA